MGISAGKVGVELSGGGILAGGSSMLLCISLDR